MPLAGLALFAQLLASTTSVTVSWSALVVATGSLSLASYLALRRGMTQERDRERHAHEWIHALAAAPADLREAPELRVAAGTSARHAMQLVSARAVLVFWRDAPSVPLRLVALHGPSATGLLDDQVLLEQLRTAAQEAVSHRRPVMREPGRASWSALPTSLFPMDGGDGGEGGLAILRGRDASPLEPIDIDALTVLAGVTSVAMVAASLRETVNASTCPG